MNLDDYTPDQLREIRKRFTEWRVDADRRCVRAAEEISEWRVEWAAQNDRADWAANVLDAVTEQLHRIETSTTHADARIDVGMGDDPDDADDVEPVELCKAPTPSVSPYGRCNLERGHGMTHEVLSPVDGRILEQWPDRDSGGDHCGATPGSQEAPPYVCTRWDGHDGIHVARDTTGTTRAVWSDDDPDDDPPCNVLHPEWNDPESRCFQQDPCDRAEGHPSRHTNGHVSWPNPADPTGAARIGEPAATYELPTRYAKCLRPTTGLTGRTHTCARDINHHGKHVAVSVTGRIEFTWT